MHPRVKPGALGMEHCEPTAISPKLDPTKQAAFIEEYEALVIRILGDEAVVFADAVHPTHAVRPVRCWAPKNQPIAVEQSSGRDRLNIHGAIALEAGQTIMKDVLVMGAASTILLLMAIGVMYSTHASNPRVPGQRPIPPREAGPSLAGDAGSPDQVPFRAGLLPAFEPDRAIMGLDAQAYHSQQMQCHIQGMSASLC